MKKARKITLRAMNAEAAAAFPAVVKALEEAESVAGPGMKIRVENHGSIVLLRPLDDEAREWLDEHLDPDGQSWGGAKAVEPRYVGPILEGFSEAGGEIL